ncbi:MAG: RNA 2',3'-cyclic phosphodiesterase [Verrucomicrobiota bacterium]|nr:RNA 2',3'-cyclic phosphodiesterase [Verrucomicrobiota bacterium]MDQ6940135.1 RNA 2',3'-cyclic phosphodiesterase [Verrucomicrobiota bacterium]
MDGKRLFVAIDFPDAIRELLVRLNPHLPGVRWLKPEQIHLTLSFLGQVYADEEKILREKLQSIHFVPFFLPITGVGTFPAKGKPRVIWTGVGRGHPQLFHLHKKVQEAALSAGLEPDLRAWHPHLTIARCLDVSAERVRPFLKMNSDFDAGLIRIESFSLYSSVPRPIGSVYTCELMVSPT